MNVQTKFGVMDDALLLKRVRTGQRDVTTEYFFGDELVHRSVETRLSGLQIAGKAKDFTRVDDDA